MKAQENEDSLYHLCLFHSTNFLLLLSSAIVQQTELLMAAPVHQQRNVPISVT